MIARPLPPNRRVRSRKSAPDVIVGAPDEQAFVEAPTVEADAPSQDGSPQVSTLGTSQSSPSRWLEGARAAAGVLVTVGAALGCVWGMVRYTRTSPRFSIRTIAVQGTSQTTPETVAKAGGLTLGQNLFGADLEAARSRILEDPWIERASLVRRLPSTVEISVVEREAAALVALGPDLYLATRDGEPFKRLAAGDPFDMPVVTGISPDDVNRDRAGAVATVKRALSALSEYERIPTAKTLPPEEVHVDDDGGFTLVVGKEPVALYVGKGPFRRPIEQAARVLAKAAEGHAHPAAVFLDNEAHPERVVVRMR